MKHRILLLVVVAVAIGLGPAQVAANTVRAGPTMSAEVEPVLIMFSGMAAVGNVVTIADRSPHYALGIGSCVLGLSTMLLTTGDVNHRTGLMLSGALSMASGLIAVRYRHVLDTTERQVRLVPFRDTRDGNARTGLALIASF